MKKVTLFVMLVFVINAVSASECNLAKLSYLLERAAAKDEEAAVKMALELGAKPDGVTVRESVDCFGGLPTSAPVMHAVKNKDTSILKLLLEAGASPNAWCCSSSAIQMARKDGNNKAVELLKKYGAK